MAAIMAVADSMGRSDAMVTMAKKAAKHGGNSSARVALPALLRLPLPQNASAIKQQFHEELQKRWLVHWRNSPRYEKVRRLNPQFPPKVYFTAHDKLNRRAANLIMQIRTQHIPLNKYLHRIKCAPSTRCEQCHEFTGTDTPKTTRHFLFECQAYVRERFKFAQGLGRKAKDIRYIMSKPEFIVWLARYITDTQRF